MVENFTTEENDTFLEEKQHTSKTENNGQFEKSLKAHLDSLVKEPSSQTIATILRYANSLNK